MEEEEEEEDAGVELGFCEAISEDAVLFEREDWRDAWDGGVAGGVAMPLIPHAEESCCSRASFLAQIYAPLDTPASAFHRSLAVYECPAHGPRCCRQQLPRENEFYPSEPSAERSMRRPRPHFEIVVESEPKEQVIVPHRLDDDDSTMPQSGDNPPDPETVDFFTRVARAPSQVLRYRRGGRPLWTRSSPKPTDIPNCPRCGAPRHFEFQLLPQLLYYLKLHDEIDFGTLAVYTCDASCDPASATDVLLEFVFRQPPIDAEDDDS